MEALETLSAMRDALADTERERTALISQLSEKDQEIQNLTMSLQKVPHAPRRTATSNR